MLGEVGNEGILENDEIRLKRVIPKNEIALRPARALIL